MFFISTERYSDFNSMIERYEQEMRRLFSEKQKNAVFEEPVKTVMAPPKKEEPPIEVVQEEKAILDGTGKIIVEVTTARGAVPIEGADIVIDRLDLDDPKSRMKLVAVETTNQSGRTREVEVKTVSRELSLVPGNGNPFSTFYVSAAEAGFEPVKNRPVDVFSNEVSILKIDLVPKPENLSGGDFQNG